MAWHYFSQFILTIRSTPPTKKPCTVRLYSAIIIKPSSMLLIGRPPTAIDKSITEIVWPRICATPRI
eukprot:UN15816